jgi:hypothetical protein
VFVPGAALNSAVEGPLTITTPDPPKPDVEIGIQLPQHLFLQVNHSLTHQQEITQIMPTERMLMFQLWI